ncbi:MAG: deoxyribose-phosphate aldolase [Ruminococcaceae bacterium]|nr:deoxyribose-phosphate aldolase [Oscillospiraceae bacterium]
MNINEILSHCDHTLLSPSATWEEIRVLCDEGMQYHTASVCIPPCHVKKAKAYVGDQLKICTVVGFPNGDSTTAVKCFEAEEAIREGADEIDTVIHIGALKEGNDGEILSELVALRKACGEKILKVIIEACLLTEEEKLRMCRIVTEAGANYIKTSTGFSKGGATREDVALMRANVGDKVKVKAAGGISTLQDAEDFLTLGADRLGSSRIVRLAKETDIADTDRY